MADNPISIASISAYEKTLSAAELEKFKQLSPAKQKEIITVFMEKSGNVNLPESNSIFPAQTIPATGLRVESSTSSSNASADANLHQETIDILKQHLAEMKEFFNTQNKKNGYVSQLAEAAKTLWNKDNTSGVIKNKIKELEDKIRLLEEAQKGTAIDKETGKSLSFEEAYFKAFGKILDKDKINEAIQAQKTYQQSKEYQPIYDKYSDALSPFIEEADDPQKQKVISEKVTKLETALTSLIGQDGLNKIYKDNNVNSDSSSAEEKYKILITQAKQLLSKSASDLQNVSQGKTLDFLLYLSEDAYQNATGDDLKYKITQQAELSKNGAGTAGSIVTSGVTMFTGLLPGAAAETGSYAINRFSDNSGDSFGTKLLDTGKDLLDNVNPLSQLESLKPLGRALGIIKEKPKYQYVLNQLQPFLLENDINQGKLEDAQRLEKLEQALDALEGKDKMQDFYKEKGVNPSQLAPEQKYRLLINYSKHLLAAKKNED